MSGPQPGRYWSELESDSSFPALRIGVMGWFEHKAERLLRRSSSDALCLLIDGEGVFMREGEREPEAIRGPGLIFVSEGEYYDYGPQNGQPWRECFWSFGGPRPAEWKRQGWWPVERRFRPAGPGVVVTLQAMFRAGADALERRDGRALDLHKLDVERWLCARAWEDRASKTQLEKLVEDWRREPQKAWSLRAAARASGLGYTSFRTEFVKRYGTSPYDFLLRLRVELAANLLQATNEPVKSISARCGFKHVETFVRAFARERGVTPSRWRRR